MSNINECRRCQSLISDASEKLKNYHKNYYDEQTNTNYQKFIASSALANQHWTAAVSPSSTTYKPLVDHTHEHLRQPRVHEDNPLVDQHPKSRTTTKTTHDEHPWALPTLQPLRARPRTRRQATNKTDNWTTRLPSKTSKGYKACLARWTGKTKTTNLTTKSRWTVYFYLYTVFK